MVVPHTRYPSVVSFQFLYYWYIKKHFQNGESGISELLNKEAIDSGGFEPIIIMSESHDADHLINANQFLPHEEIRIHEQISIPHSLQKTE